ncbi:LytR/AlgR family response regulator transcription factor [Enterococcus sp. LJL98]
MIDVFICEDQASQRHQLERMIERYLFIESLEMRLTLSTADPYELLAYLEKYPSTIGVYFLDIDLSSDMNGLQLGAKIRNLCVDGKIIFITTHQEWLPLTFEYKVEAMDYILKDEPNHIARRVTEALEQARKHYTSENKDNRERIRIEVGHQVRLFDLEEVLFFETSLNSHKLILHLTHGSLEFYGRLAEVEQLSDAFLRVHKSYVVNQKNITQIDRKQRRVIFKNGETCVASTRQIKPLERALKMK